MAINDSNYRISNNSNWPVTGRYVGCVTMQQWVAHTMRCCLMIWCTHYTSHKWLLMMLERSQWLPVTRSAPLRTQQDSRSIFLLWSMASWSLTSVQWTWLLSQLHPGSRGNLCPLVVQDPLTVNSQLHQHRWQWCQVISSHCDFFYEYFDVV